jgi:hypothetical protein
LHIRCHELIGSLIQFSFSCIFCYIYSYLKMRTIPSILSSALAVFLLISYLIGMIFGSGLHVHGLLHHDQEDPHLHTRALAAHVHDTDFISFPGSHSVSLLEDEHHHPVHVLHIIAVSASKTTPMKPYRHSSVCADDPSPVLSYYPSVSTLYICPRETSSTIRSISHSGRSPPSA